MPSKPRAVRFDRSGAAQRAYDAARGSYRQRGYSTQWDKVKRLYRKANPLCEQCLREGRTTLAVDVDHITPIARGGDLLDERNLQSLCRRCHNIKTAMERRR